MDKLGADFYFTVETHQGPPRREAARYPAADRCRGDFVGVVDLVEMKALVWPETDESLGPPTRAGHPGDLRREAERVPRSADRGVADADEELMEKYLEGEEITEDEIKAAIRKLTLNSGMVPDPLRLRVQEQGCQPMLDAVVDYLPSRSTSRRSTVEPSRRREDRLP